MCNFKNWFFDDNGYVVQCESCNYFQVSFGTLMLTLDTLNFEALIDVVSNNMATLVPMKNKDIKCIILPLPSGCINAILTERELRQLHFMLEEADTDIRAHRLMELF